MNIERVDENILWRVEPIDEQTWSQSRWLFDDMDKAVAAGNPDNDYLVCQTSLGHLQLVRYRSWDKCSRKFGQRGHTLGDRRLEHFILRTQHIDFISHCRDQNNSSLFKPVHYKCQAKGKIIRQTPEGETTVHAVLRFPIELVAEIPTELAR